MDLNSIKEQLSSKKAVDYTYAIMFLIVSTFFIFFVIKPVLSIAVKLRREASDLERINKIYDQNITKVLSIQADLQTVDPVLYLIDDALPDKPQTEGLINDVLTAGKESGTPIRQVIIDGLNIKGGKIPKGETDLHAIGINVSIRGDFNQVSSFVKALENQRRIKTVNSISIVKSTTESLLGDSSSVIDLKMEVSAYYLAPLQVQPNPVVPK